MSFFKVGAKVAALSVSIVLFFCFNVYSDSSLQLNSKSFTSIDINYDSLKNKKDSIDIGPLENIRALAVDADIYLKNSRSYVRFIAVDSNGGEYLVYEVNSALTMDKNVKIEKGCEETASLSNVTVTTLLIESEDADVKLHRILYEKGRLAFRSFDNFLLKEKQVKEKIDKINKVLKAGNKSWVAGDTPISRLSYSEKKAMFGGKVPNLFGFEYYKGGIFVIPSSDKTSNAALPKASSSPYVADFTWENRHGENWVTSVKSQGGCGSCWAFASAGSTELMVNLYFNQHLDLNLSEQDLVSCSGAGSCTGGLPGTALNYIASTGIVSETCFPYETSDSNCSKKCGTPNELIRIGGKTGFYRTSEDDLKKLVIKGPVSFGLYSWSHAIGLVGYKTIKEGDRIHVQSSTESKDIIIDAGNELIGKTAWRIKNSWGDWWGQNGFAYVVTDLLNIGWTWGLTGKVTNINYSDSDIKCVDKDGDGYYNWGIGEKPSTCPASPEEEDGDDSNPLYGPMDQYGNLTNITDYVSMASPSDGEIIEKPEEIIIEAAAKGITGNVTRVDFYVDSNLEASDSSFPYSFVYLNPKAGRHEIYAKSYVDSGKTAESSKVNIIVSGKLGEGKISRFIFNDISGGSISDLLASPKYPDSPDLSDERTSFYSPENIGDFYGTRMIGHLYPPISGTYQFWISGDDNSELYLSTDRHSSNKTLIAQVKNWTSFEQWDRETSQASSEIYLEKDKAYFIEALHKEGSGGDHLEVAWKIPGGDRKIIDGRFLSPYNEYTINFSVNGHGSISGTLTQKVNSGEDASTVVASPSQGYHFTGWTGDYTGTEAELTLENIRKNMAVQANFEVNKYEVKFVSSSNGSIEGVTPQTVDYDGKSSKVKAVPAQGYHFTGWTGDYTGTEAELTLENIRKNMTVQANFEPNIYEVRFISSGNGQIKGESVQNIRHGMDCSSIEAVPFEGYHFVSWSGGCSGSEKKLDLKKITSSMTVYGNFEINKYKVKFIASQNGSVSGESEQIIEYGKGSSAVQAVPSEGYVFSSWSGAFESSQREILVDNVKSDMEITANFVKKEDKSSSSDGGGGGGGCFVESLF